MEYEIKQLHPIWETSNILFDEIISRKFDFENYQAWIFADQKFWKGQIVFKHLPIFFPRNLHFPRRDIRIQPFQNIVVKSIMKLQ